MPRPGLNRAAVISAGAALADEIGFPNVTMGLLAERVGVRTPSLYKHVESLDALRHDISVQAMRELRDAVAGAVSGRSGPDAVRAIAGAHRRWALDHPGRHAATVRAPATDDEEGRRVVGEAMQVFLNALNGFGLNGTQAVDAARVLRSALHGFVSLECAGGFGLPREVARSYRFLVETLVEGLRAA
ncbi:WHG domain-containing protein [Lentzea sp. DG1S-22]|uniref:TetR/AcrR family transcriptional regulator n=1 Tax=Lentzea sp. DG1S-22 TaxID=3108822 RepID=UPI002E76040F|nr:WHG domain-containing protein [Lentzea sp. DG1S-22]WVH81565.1 WHG domain-containing protein [Lentzea sp. DG1S-22]